MLDQKKKLFSLSINLKRFALFIVFFLVGSISFFAQYTDVINSNKPGFSESPYSVGTNVYQFESNLFFRNISTEPTFSIPQSLGLDLLFRTSFLFEKLELSAQFAYQRDKVAFKNIFTSQYFASGFSKMTFGAKYLLYQEDFDDKTKQIRSFRKRHGFDKKRLIPAVAVYLGMNTDLVGEIHKKGRMTPKVGVLLQHNLTKNFNLITNIFYDNIGSDFSEFSYIITATQSFGGQWSVFFENQTILQKKQNNTNLALGFAYLFSKDLQFNSSGRLLFEGKAQGFYAGLGVSYRINNHEDAYKELDENGEELKDTPISKYNKKQNNFFNRLFNVFKKKDKSIRTRPKRTRKRKTKRNKGGFFGLFKKKEKEDADKDEDREETGLEKLEREIKEIEEEIERENKVEKEMKKKNRKNKKKDTN
ncbi:MAG: hypothetical protein ACJAVE_000952 [Polaribacter sp.]|jgi:hypothetical protein|tara:strand:+ start:680 stop:1936 length:1257 start_codon:yes stop_codon:yes gene_type:complete